MIPDFREDGCLPEGIHKTTRQEFADRFVVFDRSDRRFRLYAQLEKLLDEAEKSRIVKSIIMVGSFVTAKPEPSDFDCILVMDASVVGRKLRPFEYNVVSRKAARRMFGGDVVPAIEGSKALDVYLEFFQTARDGRRVGMVEIQL